LRNLFVVAFDDELKAEKVCLDLLSLKRGHLVDVEEAVVVIVSPERSGFHGCVRMQPSDGRDKKYIGDADMNTYISCKRVVSALILGALILASATGVQSQSAADVQNAIGILTNPSNSPQDRINAARNLGVLGQDSNSAAEALIGVLSSDPNPAVRSAAAVALGSAAFPSDAPIQALIQALNSDSSPEVRLAAVKGLEVVGVDSDSALQALQSAAANDSNPGVRQLAQAVYNRFSSGTTN
jgi:HEAT repeat protein